MKRFTYFLPSLILVVALLDGSQALAQIAFVKTIGTNASKSSGTNLAVTVPAGGVAAGNSPIVSLAMDPATGTVSCTDSAKNSYAVDRDQLNGSGTSGVRTVIFSAHNVAALVSGNTITCTHPSVAARALSASEFSGLAVSGTRDQFTSSSGQRTSASSGNTGTTTQATELLIGAIGVEGPSGDTFTPGSSYTTTGRGGTTGGNALTNITINPEYRIVSATSAYAATGTLSNSRKWAAGIVTYNAALPTKLVITSVNGGTNPIAGPPGFSVTIQSQNANNNPIAVGSATGVSLTLKTGTGTLGGTLSGTIAVGTSQVVISGVTYTKAESGVVITATRTSGDSLTAGDSAAFTVKPGSPSTLALVTQPGNSPLGGTLVGPPSVAVRDSFGNTVTSSTALITITVPTPGYAVLTGTTSKNATAGIATFNDLMVSPVGNGYALVASSSGFSNVTSSTFNIVGATGTIAGAVSRADNAAPINGATIEAFQAGVSMGSATSASNGSYSVSGLPTGIYELSASAAGYTAQPKSGVTVILGGTSTANFSLTAEKIVYVYDTLSRLRAVIDIAGQTATYSYDAVGNLLGISRYSSSQTSVIDFAPTKGPVGTSVTIYGTGFSLTPSQNTVTFNGTAGTVISSSTTQLLAAVLAGATTGPIGVTAPSGSASSTVSFTVTSSSGIPTVTNFTPTIGAVGTPVTVTGTNFDTTPSKNDLRFNNARGAISSSTATSIATTVPSGAGSGRISVTTVLGKGTSGADFFVVPSGLTTTDIEFMGRLSTNGTPLTVTIITANKQGLIVFDGVAGQRLSLRVTNDTFPLACAWCSDVGLQFILPDGRNWVSTGWANANAHYYEPPALPASGTYTIQFKPEQSVGPGATGQATLELFNITGEDWGTITAGVPVTVSVAIPGQNPQFSFTRTAGNLISLDVTNANFPLPCGSCQAAYVYIYKPDGTTLAQGTWANATGTFIDVQFLPLSGVYRIVLNPELGNTGHATLTLRDVMPLSMSYAGKIRDRVGQGDAALSADGTMDGTFNLSLPVGSGSRTVTSLVLKRNGGGGNNGEWDTIPGGFWVVGAASGLDAALYNAADATVNFSLSDGGSFTIFGSDWGGSLFNSGAIFVLTANYADGSSAAGTVTLP